MSGSLSALPPQVLAALMQRMGGQGQQPGGIAPPMMGAGMPQPGMGTPMSGITPPNGMAGGMQRPMTPPLGQAPQPQGFGQTMQNSASPILALLAQMKQGQSGVQAPNGQGGVNPGAPQQAQPGGANPQFLQWLQSQMGGGQGGAPQAGANPWVYPSTAPQG